MKTAFLLLFAMGLSIITCGQETSFKKRTLQEMTCMIDNPLEFLGKTDSAIKAAGRPASIVGGDIWEVDVMDTNKKNALKASKTIVIGTGCGALMLVVSEKTNLVYIMTFLAHKNSKVRGATLMNALKDKYPFDSKGNSYYWTNDSSRISLSLLEGGFILMAFNDQGSKVKFAN